MERESGTCLLLNKKDQTYLAMSYIVHRLTKCIHVHVHVVQFTDTPAKTDFVMS